MSSPDAPSSLDALYIDEAPLLQRAAWPQIAALAGIALAALLPLVIAIVLAA